MDNHKGFYLYEVVTIKPKELKNLDGLTGQIIDFVTLPDWDGGEVTYIKLRMADNLPNYCPPPGIARDELLVYPFCISKYVDVATDRDLVKTKNKYKSIQEVLEKCKQKAQQ